MVIYEVNLTLEAAIVSEFHEWLDIHIADMLKLHGFQQAQLMKVEDATGYKITVAYTVETREALEAYFQGAAARMRDEGIARFGGRFEATRRILTPLGDAR